MKKTLPVSNKDTKKKVTRKTKLEIAAEAPGQKKITTFFKPTKNSENQSFFKPEFLQILSLSPVERNDSTVKRSRFEQIIFKSKCAKMRASRLFTVYHGTKVFRKLLHLKKFNLKIYRYTLKTFPDCDRAKYRHSITNQSFFKYFQ
jgi:hypothetical protein